MPHGKSTGRLGLRCLPASAGLKYSAHGRIFLPLHFAGRHQRRRFFQGTAMTYFGGCVERADKLASRALEAPRPRSVVTSPYTAGVAELADARDSKAKTASLASP